MYENRQKLEDWEDILLVCLELGFRHLDPYKPHTYLMLAHTKHHRGLVDVVFKSQKSEAIADLLHAWTLGHRFSGPAGTLVDVYTGLLVGLHSPNPFSRRSRRLVIRFIERAGYEGLEGSGVEKLIGLLDCLHVTAEEMGRTSRWPSLLLDIIRSPEGTRRLSDWYWESLVERAVSWPRPLKLGDTDTLKIARLLIEAEEWRKLECWIGIVWTVSKSAGITEENLEHLTLLLFHQRPGAAQRLEQWMERWSQRLSWNRVPESFHRILTRTHEAVQRQDAP